MDNDDVVARLHDEDYARPSSSSGSVYIDDHIAINQFLEEAKESPHAILGAVGLGLKTVVETFSGQIYPRMPPVKRDHRGEPIAEPEPPPGEVQTEAEGSSGSGEVESTAVGHPVEMSSGQEKTLEGNRGGEPGGTGGNLTVIHSAGASNSTVTFKREWRIQSRACTGQDITGTITGLDLGLSNLTPTADAYYPFAM